MKRSGVLDKYLSMLNDFIVGSVSIEELQALFFKEFKNEPLGMDGELYEVLNETFSDLDVYTEDEYLLRKFPDNYQGRADTEKKILLAVKRLEKIKAAI